MCSTTSYQRYSGFKVALNHLLCESQLCENGEEMLPTALFTRSLVFWSRTYPGHRPYRKMLGALSIPFSVFTCLPVMPWLFIQHSPLTCIHSSDYVLHLSHVIPNSYCQTVERWSHVLLLSWRLWDGTMLLIVFESLFDSLLVLRPCLWDLYCY